MYTSYADIALYYNGVKNSSRRGDVTTKSTAEWWKGAVTAQLSPRSARTTDTQTLRSVMPEAQPPSSEVRVTLNIHRRIMRVGNSCPGPPLFILAERCYVCNSRTGCPKKIYHICFVYSFYSFQHSQLRPTSKDSQFHGDLLTLPMDSVASSWLSLWHVLEVSVFLGHTALLGVWPPRPNIRLGKSRE